MALLEMAGVAAAIHRPVRAVHLFGAVEAALEALNETKDPISQKESDRDMVLIREQLDEEAIQRVWTEGQEMNIEEAFKEAFDIKLS